jgi:hypothetical protein
MEGTGRARPADLIVSVIDNDPQLALALVRMEFRFSQLINQITLVFNAMLRFMKHGNIPQWRAAKEAMRTLSQALTLALQTSSSQLRNLPIP